MSNFNFREVARIGVSLLGILGCAFCILTSAQFGFSRLLSRYGLNAMSLPATSAAIRLRPLDADAHRAQAAAFRNFGMFQQARNELEIAASIRPRDDYLWLELADTRDELGDVDGALNAFDQAVANAPFYAHPRWQRANLRLRLGRYDEAFAEMRAAAASNRAFLPTLIDLSWNLSQQNARLTEQLAGIQSTESRIEFARYLSREGKGPETLEQYRLVARNISLVYKKQLVTQLLAAHIYPEAFEIWRDTNGTARPVGTSIYDGGFESPVSLNEAGFGWRIRQESNLEVSQDISDHDSGAKSARVVFNGSPFSRDAVVAQTVYIERPQNYKISFAFKSRNLVSGGPLVLQVCDAASDQTLTEFEVPVESDWQRHSLQFTTPQNCRAIELRLARKECSSSPCPIFGTLWLDSFSIEQIPQ
jgi:tetratricopeptide (TPR) repeat protein